MASSTRLTFLQEKQLLLKERDEKNAKLKNLDVKNKKVLSFVDGMEAESEEAEQEEAQRLAQSILAERKRKREEAAAQEETPQQKRKRKMDANKKLAAEQKAHEEKLVSMFVQSMQSWKEGGIKSLEAYYKGIPRSVLTKACGEVGYEAIDEDVYNFEVDEAGEKELNKMKA